MKRWLTIVNLLLIAGVVYFGVQTYRLMAAPRPELPVRLPAAENRFRQADGDRQRPVAIGYRDVIRRNLFDTKTDTGPVPDSLDVGALARTRLDLKLWGTVTGDEKEPCAVIEETGKHRQRLFRTGDVVGKATVKLILREKVVLRVDGRDEVLAMEKFVDRPGKVRSPATARPAAGTEAPLRRQVALDSAQVKTALDDVNALVRQVRIRPYFENGKPAGFSLTGIRPDSIFRRMGLRNGDIVTGINGEQPETVKEALSMIGQAETSADIELRVRRRGKDQVISYTME